MRAVIKVKIYARRTKTQMLRQSLGNTRFVWNKLLEMQKEGYEKEKYLWEYEINRDLNASINILKMGVDKISWGHGEYMREIP